MEFYADDLIKLMLAVLIGGIVGAEREYRDKSAGFRTLIFICVGSTLFTMISIKIATNSDPARIAAQVVTGVGFLGAGAILRNGGQVVGLTTAAMIWLVAALGVAVGSGHYLLASVGAGLALIVLLAFPILEDWIDNTRHIDTYEVICDNQPGRYEELLAFVRQTRFKVISTKRNKVKENMIIIWVLLGSPKAHAALSAYLLDNPNVKEFRH